MYDTILVPTDGSDVAGAAGAAAVALAGRVDASIRAVHVLERSTDGPVGEAAERAVRDVAALADDAGVTASTEVIDASEPVHHAVAGAADGADLVAMGTHGRTGIDRFVLGSVAERTLRRSPAPVLTVHEGTGIELEDADVLVPTDGSACSGAAVDHAVAFAAATDARLHAVSAVDPGIARGEVGDAGVLDSLEQAGRAAIEEATARAEIAGVDVAATAVRTGAPHRVILEYAVANGVDLIVMGTHGWTGIERYLLGSVAERIVRLADVPVIGVKPDGPGE